MGPHYRTPNTGTETPRFSGRDAIPLHFTLGRFLPESPSRTIILGKDTTENLSVRPLAEPGAKFERFHGQNQMEIKPSRTATDSENILTFALQICNGHPDLLVTCNWERWFDSLTEP